MDFPARSFNPNKHLKEQFVSNLTGSSMLEIFSLTIAISIVIHLRRIFGFNYFDGFTTFKKKVKKKSHSNNVYNSKTIVAYAGSMLVDFVFIIFPILLLHTVLADYVNVLAISLAFALLLCFVSRRYFTSDPGNLVRSSSVRPLISSYRVYTMIITCLSILAVDFQIFPRRYAKTETYGTGWMDLGVGSFVMANGLVSRQARNVSSVTWKKSIQSAFPLILLGFGRLLSTTGVDYQVHVGEYGVHWNFFFTMASVSILSSVINIHPKYCGIIGLLILAAYQICLVKGLNIYLLSSERSSSIISQNKEGIFSIFGYLSLYMVGVHLGYLLFFRHNSSGPISRSNRAVAKLWVLSSAFWLFTVLLERHVERVSRRMCNMAYVTLICASNLQGLAMSLMTEHLPGSNFSLLEEAFDQNLLALFLLANVLTGSVNLSMDTLSASSGQALGILTMYAFVLCLFAGLVHFHGMRVKFW